VTRFVADKEMGAEERAALDLAKERTGKPR
jgi:hypothetical protein